jgi:signal transduction histidine kinase
VRVDVDEDVVRLEIQDDGVGFVPSAPTPGHNGLESMQSRANEIGAALSVASALGQGTVIQVEVPVEKGE